jgi:glycosyltransferase involved in cell wall biosynthesis
VNVLVLSNVAPFIRGGAEELAEHLVLNLCKRPGANAELLRIPFQWDPASAIIGQILLNKSLRLANVDRVIAMKFPAYLIPHENKIIWLMHQYRQAYDLDRDGMTNIPADGDGDKIRNAIRTADNACFSGSKQIYTISPVVSARLQQFNGVRSEALHHRLNDPELFTGGEYRPYIFAGGRVGEGKRQHLLVEAMRHVHSGVRLIVAGPPESPEYAERLQEIVSRFELADRVELRLSFLPRLEVVELVNNARACASIPVDEDSMSYVAMEAFAAKKCVITATDSGGLLELVKHRETGFVVSPDPAAIAVAFENVCVERRGARLGKAARDLWDRLDITWPSRIDRLLS